MYKSIYRYIIRYSLRQQIVLTVMAVASFPFLYMFYELPKKIVNEAILAKKIVYPVELATFEFDQLDWLWLLCGAFLVLVIINQGFKYVINVYRGRTGERMLRRLRYDLYARVLRFPMPAIRKTSTGETVQMISAETEPLGGFIGDAFSVPVFQGGYLIVILAFLLLQNWIMAIAATALYPIQLYIIPKLQRRVNLMAKERVRRVRRLSDRIGETMSGVQEIHTHDTAALELASFSRVLGEIYEIRLKIYIWKFVIKFLNNSINQLGPFSFYALGGYFVYQGSLEVGTLMAAIAAHKDLAAPWKELLTYYQQREDARIKFEQIVEQFEPAGMLDPEIQLGDPAEIPTLSGRLVASNLGLTDDTGSPLIEGTSFTADLPSHIAVVGGAGSGKEELALLAARLIAPTSGSLTIAGMKTVDMPLAVSGRRMSYVGSGSHLFSTTVRDNLVYGLKHRPLAPVEHDDVEAAAHVRYLSESEASGNSPHDIFADWIDYEAAGAADAASLIEKIFEALALVDLDGDIYEFGLRGTIRDSRRADDLAARFLAARRAFRERLSDPQIAALVETFDEEKYNDNASVGENLLFGTPVGGAFDMDRLAEHPYVLALLDRLGMTEDFLAMGQQIATTMIEIFADLPPGHEFFEQFSFISSEDLPDYQAILGRIVHGGVAELRPEERTRLLSLPFRIVSARHRLGIIDDERRRKILTARKEFREKLPETLRDSVSFFSADAYNMAATLQDNILFGKLAYGQAHSADRVRALIAEVIDGLDLRPAVMEVGLDFHVGIGGGRLSSAQRQKLAIARAILKNPDILVLNAAMSSLDGAAQARIMERLLDRFAGKTLLWVLSRVSLAQWFGLILVMRGGRVVDKGTFDDLKQKDGEFKSLLESE